MKALKGEHILSETTISPNCLPQLTIEIKFYLNQTAQNIIEVGKRLIQAKELVAHGEWQNWLQNNFNLKYTAATRFMQIAERFSNLPTSEHLNTSQMFEMLALPAGDEEKFIKNTRFKAGQNVPRDTFIA